MLLKQLMKPVILGTLTSAALSSQFVLASTSPLFEETSVRNLLYNVKVFSLKDPKLKSEHLQGLNFKCNAGKNIELVSEVNQYLSDLNIDPKLYDISISSDGKILNYKLTASEANGNTLDLSKRPSLNIQDDDYVLDNNDGSDRVVKTVSKKEIILATMQTGRITTMEGVACNIESLKEYVGVRQNIAAWVQGINWDFPSTITGGESRFNPEFWEKDENPKRDKIYEALHDSFVNDRKYAMGCYDATILSVAHGILDYYKRVNPNEIKFNKVIKDLLSRGPILDDVIPGNVWSNLPGFTKEESKTPGKLLTFSLNVGKLNFIPGDWIYIKNPDEESRKEVGYEGSNAIYLGRNFFDDYYNETPNRRYSFEEKISEVYNWRLGVKNSDDKKKPPVLTGEFFEKQLVTPEKGGLLRSHRMFYKNY